MTWGLQAAAKPSVRALVIEVVQQRQGEASQAAAAAATAAAAAAQVCMQWLCLLRFWFGLVCCVYTRLTDRLNVYIYDEQEEQEEDAEEEEEPETAAIIAPAPQPDHESEDEFQDADEEATAMAEDEAAPIAIGPSDGLSGFQLEEEPATLLAAPLAAGEGYGVINDQMGGGEFGGFQQEMEDIAGLALFSDDEGEGGVGMDVDGGGAGGGDASQEF